MTASAVRHLPSLPADRDLPRAAELLAGAGAARVARFLAERGVEPDRIEPAQAHYRPGRWLALCFRTAAVERSSGRPVCLTVIVDSRPGEDEAVWAFPDDPSLPGLPVAADGRALRRRLRPRPADVVVEPVRYRPRRRAVLRYRLVDEDGCPIRLAEDAGPARPGRRPELFAKVLTPARAGRLLTIADALRTGGAAGAGGLRLALPAARVGPGVLVLPSLPGIPLRALLLAGRPLPSPDRMAGLPEALHHRCAPLLAPADDRRTGRPADRRVVDPCTALTAARMVARLLPDHGCTAGRLAEAVIGWAESSDQPDEWFVHGDLYENQVLVDGDRLGLIDLDDLGPGDPLLDAANFSAHLLLLGTSGAPAGGVILRYRDELRAAFCRRFDADPAALAWREAYCLLKLAGGPFRVLHPEWPRRMADRVGLAAATLAARP